MTQQKYIIHIYRPAEICMSRVTPQKNLQNYDLSKKVIRNVE